MRAIVFGVLLLHAAPLAPAQATAPAFLGRVRPDVDLAAGFASCEAPPGLYARLQDELLFAVGAEDLLPSAATLAGVDSGAGIPNLLVAARGSGRLALVPAPATAAPAELPGGSSVRRLDDGSFAVGDLGLLRDGGVAGAPLEPPAGSGPAGGRCAWVTARPAWLHGDEASAVGGAGWSVLGSLTRAHGLIVTADYSAEVVLTLRVAAGGPPDAAVLADALGEFLASRRGNPGAAEAVRSAVEKGTVEQQADQVTLRLPLSPPALDRIRHNVDSRALLRLRLDDGERERWQRVADVVQALGLREGDAVADVGAGEGFFSVRLAGRVGATGHVFAVEILDKAVAALSQRARAASLANVQAVLGAVDDPRLPSEALNAVLVVNAYHEMTAYKAMLSRFFEALRPGGRLVLVEPWAKTRRREPRDEQVKDHILAPELAEEELRQAGFAILWRDDDFVAREQSPEWLIQAARPAPDRSSADPR